MTAVKELLKIISKILEENSQSVSRTKLFVESFKLVRRYSKVEDPYRDEKRKIIHYFKENVLKVVKEFENDFEKLVKACINANLLDVEMREHKYTLEEIREKLLQDVKMNLSEDLPSLVRRYRRVVYVLDNVGEHFIDIMLARLLRKKFNVDVTLVVRQEPYEIDVTIADIQEDVPRDLQVVSSPGCESPILHLQELFDLRDTLVISKGIANFEAYLDSRETFRKVENLTFLFMLVAKCSPLASLLKVPFRTGVVLTSQCI